MSHYSFFSLTAPPLTSDDALPGVSCDEATFLALIEVLHDAIDAFQDTYADLTYGDAIHAAKCVITNLAHDWAADTADA